MNNRTFDEALRRRLEKEEFEVNPAVEEKIRQTMRSPVMRRGTRRVARRSLRLAPVFAALMVTATVALTLAQPPKDATNGQTSPVDQPVIVATTGVENTNAAFDSAPRVHIGVRYAGRKAEFTAEIVNNTQSTWVLQWRTSVEHHELNGWTQAREPEQLLWLEPGSSCTDKAVWLAFESAPQTLACGWQYTGYRVDGGMLFWIDGYRQLGEEGYAEQQMLLEEAFDAESLLISAGEWENGEAGAVELVLPERYQRQHPGETALQYYRGMGALNEDSAKECNGSGFDDYERAVRPDMESEPLAEGKAECYTPRLMTAEIGSDYLYFVIDSVFESEAAFRKAKEGYPRTFYTVYVNGKQDMLSAEKAEKLGVTVQMAADASGYEWQDGSGAWHVTRCVASYPVDEIHRGDMITLKAVYGEAGQTKAVEEEPVTYIVP